MKRPIQVGWTSPEFGWAKLYPDGLTNDNQGLTGCVSVSEKLPWLMVERLTEEIEDD